MSTGWFSVCPHPVPHTWGRGERSPGPRAEEPAAPHPRLRPGLALSCPPPPVVAPPCRAAPPSSDRRENATSDPCTLPSRRDSVAPGRVPSSRLSCPFVPTPGCPVLAPPPPGPAHQQGPPVPPRSRHLESLPALVLPAASSPDEESSSSDSSDCRSSTMERRGPAGREGAGEWSGLPGPATAPLHPGSFLTKPPKTTHKPPTSPSGQGRPAA